MNRQFVLRPARSSTKIGGAKLRSMGGIARFAAPREMLAELRADNQPLSGSAALRA